MIVDNSPSSTSDRKAIRAKRLVWSRASWLRMAGLLVLFWAASFALQVSSGAYHSEFAGYPDESAHYVTALMVHDYVVQLKPVSPMAYAKNYYAHYPKVAFGHWPPLLYIVQAAWMLVFSTSRASVLLELAFLTALLALSVCVLVKRRFGLAAGVAAGLLLTCLPIIQVYTDEVMSEILLTLVSLWAAIFFTRYMDSERWQDSFWFGVFSSLAILTKGNGWEIGLAPPVAIFLTRRWRLLTRPSFWLPVAIVMVFCLPWQLFTFEWAHQGWEDRPGLAFASHALVQFLLILSYFMGPILTAVAVLGVAVTVIAPYFRKTVEAEWAVMIGLVLGVWVFHAIVPAGIESRKMIVAVPALVLFLFAGGAWLAHRIPVGAGYAFWRPILLTSILGLIFFSQTFTIPREYHYGFTEAAELIASSPELRNQIVLVSSDWDGEGLLISEVAMHEPRPTHTFLRASKVLSKSNWNGSTYQSFFANTSELSAYLKRADVGVVVIDTFHGRSTHKDLELIRDCIKGEPNSWRLLKSFSSPAGTPFAGNIQVYRFGY